MAETVFIPVWALITASIAFAALLVATVLWARAIHSSASLFRAVAEGASDGLVLMERDSKIIWTNAAYSQTMGYAHGELIGQYPLEFALPPHLAISKEEARSFRFDKDAERFGSLQMVENMRKNGETFMHEFSHAVIQIGKDKRYLLVGRDVSDRVAREQALIAAEAKLKTQSRTDALTGLYNRYELRRRLERAIRCGLPFAVLQFDLNGMKQINDTYGHLAGDRLLIHVAEAFRSLGDDNGVCARMGGDEFTLLLPEEPSLRGAKATAERLVDAVGQTFTFGTATMSGDISAGVAIWARNLDADQILHRADLALYAAKTSDDQAVICYDEAFGARHAEKEHFESEVVTALKTKRFSFHFQPIVNIDTHAVEKFEMLIRWKHPELGTVSPDRFLPVIARMRMTADIDQLVIECAIRAIAELDRSGLRHVGLSINLSAEAFLTPNLTDQLAWHAECGRLDPARISLEILESTAFSMAEEDLATQLLARLKTAGFRVFLDDFGMGYAGLAHLAALPATGLKIDKELTSAVDRDVSSRLIVAALVGLANDLGLDIVAEGVENMAQMEIVRQAGCKVFQGFAVARPMPLRRALTWAQCDGDTVRTGTDP